MADLDALVGSNMAEATEKRSDADALVKDSEKIRAEEAVRKANITNAVNEADLECQEVDKLRESIKELTQEKEKSAADLKLKLDNEESNISAVEAEIASTIDELSSIEKQSTEHKERTGVEKVQALKEIADAKKLADMIKHAYENAQKNANDFSSLPDAELALQMKQLDEAEQDIIDDANRERGEIIESELLIR